MTRSSRLSKINGKLLTYSILRLRGNVMGLLQLIFVGLLALGLIGCGSTPSLQTYPQPVSMIDLRESPSKYDGMIIAVSGYLNGRENRLYLTTEHRGIEYWSNSIVVSVSYTDEEREKGQPGDPSKYPSTGCNEQFVLVYGRWKEEWADSIAIEGLSFQYILSDVFEIADMKRVEDWGRGPPRGSCWHNIEADPIRDIMIKYHTIK